LTIFRLHNKDKTMDDFVLNIIKGRSVEPPSQVEKAFCMSFSSAMNIEWYIIKDAIYEAIFYNENHEHIARFDESGELIDYRVNLVLSELPEKLIKTFKNKGEIMNVVAIYRENEIKKYEVIIRDELLKRQLVLIDATYKTLKETDL
jgi:hypothetical protein